MTPTNYAILPFYRYFDFKGRSSRSEFWWFTLLCFLVGILFFIISINTMPSFDKMMDPFYDDSWGLIDYVSALWSLAVFIPSLSVSVRRLHDLNRTGWWLMAFIGGYFISTVLIIGGIVAIAASLALAMAGDINAAPASLGGAYMMIALGFGGLIGVFVWSIVWYAMPSVHQDNRFGPPTP